MQQTLFMLARDLKKCNRLHIYSIVVEIRGSGADRLARDFDFFSNRPTLLGEDQAAYSVDLELLDEEPQKNDLPVKPADQIFPDCVLYRQGQSYIYDYFGKALLFVERDAQGSRGILKCRNENLREELGYLFLQSELGRYLDKQGLHRVHALGFGLPSGRAGLVMLPSGGGKSTLALEILKREGFRLLSDDTPLIDRRGRVHPYPLRLSFREGQELPAEWMNDAILFERRKHGRKVLVPISALPSSRLPRLNEIFAPGFLIIGARHGAQLDPVIRGVSRRKSIFPLMRDLVVGIGVPQVVELLLSKGVRSLPGMVPQIASRAVAATMFAARAKPLYFELSQDAKKNAELLCSELLKQDRS